MKRFLPLAAILVLSLPSAARAYPSSAVFTPTADSKELGEYGALAWGSVQLGPAPAAGASWFGLQAGLLPRFGLGRGLKFGGLEAGADAVLSGGTAKPVFNVKLSPLAEGSWSPGVALGLMSGSPRLPSLSLSYLSLSRTLGPYGRLHAGLGARLGDESQLQSTFPFSGTRWLGMAAYESPLAWDRLGLVADWLGGTSEVSSTYLGATFLAVPGCTLSAGGFFSNQRTSPSDGVYFSVSLSGDVRK